MYDSQIMLVANIINEDVGEPDIYSAPFDEAYVPKIAAVIGHMISINMHGNYDKPSMKDLVLQSINNHFRDPKTKRIAYLILNKLLSDVKEVITPSNGKPPNVGTLKRVTKNDPQYDEKKIAYYRNTVDYWIKTFNYVNPKVMDLDDNTEIREHEVDHFLETHQPYTGPYLLKGSGIKQQIRKKDLLNSVDNPEMVWRAKEVKKFVKAVYKYVTSLKEKIKALIGQQPFDLANLVLNLDDDPRLVR